MCFLETHVLQDKQQTVIDRIFPHCHHIDNYEHARLGKIWILFAADIRLHVHSSSLQTMHCHVFSENAGKYFFLYVIYATNNEVARRTL